MKEIWKDIEGYEGLYKCSLDGLIKSLPRNTTPGKILSGGISASGYRMIWLYKDGHRRNKNVHRIIAETFIPNPKNLPQVNHKNGNKLDNRKKNLEWTTESGNAIHAFKIKLRTPLKGENHGMAKLTNLQIVEIRKEYKGRGKGLSHQQLANKFNVSRQLIGFIINNKNWK
jgi:DNA-binding transcriptional regulator YiaG